MADRIVVLADGTVEAIGTHEELLAAGRALRGAVRAAGGGLSVAGRGGVGDVTSAEKFIAYERGTDIQALFSSAKCSTQAQRSNTRMQMHREFFKGLGLDGFDEVSVESCG